MPADSIPVVAPRLRAGELDLDEYLAGLEERCRAVEPEVLALLREEGRFERLRRDAAALRGRFPAPAERPVLYGVPVAVKDIFRVDGFPTRAGSRLPESEFEGGECESVAALKRAGALVLGKAVSTEFAYFAPGPTRNPHDPERTPGGSSSGSAAAVAAGLCPLALGTQTIGSIGRPASFCGVAGYKPSYDRVSRSGVVPLAPSLDHVGTFTADAGGAALAASVLCASWRPAPPGRMPVLGAPEGPYLDRASDEGRKHFRRTTERLAAAGYEVKPVAALADFEAVEARHHRIVAAEAFRVHAGWYARYRDLYHPKTVDLLERGRPVSDGELEDALAGRETLRRELDALMKENGLDLWISPAAPGPAPKGLDSTGDPVMNLPWTHAGLPTLVVPAGTDPDGLPMGLQIAAGWWQDEALLAWGEGIERALFLRSPGSNPGV